MAVRYTDKKYAAARSTSLALGALGVVFGEIGTSPLYVMRVAFHGSHSIPITPDNVMGILSLILWSLVLVISVKYPVLVTRADNRGEGGVLALTALAAPPRLVRRGIINRFALYIGLFGAALLFGDGVLTPAISVLSAVEGLRVATPFFNPYVIPITIIILAGIFFGQRFGTGKIGAIFGPVILLWFIFIGLLGILGISQNPAVLQALNPFHAYQFFVQNGWAGFMVLGAVFLSVAGGEALYADMGHFGRKAIQSAWYGVALPALVLNYYGQGALLLNNPAVAENPFFNLAPPWTLYPLVFVATLAAIIASQALIAGVFSLTRQAIQLGFSPRILIVHTSKEEIGQIYVPYVNWMLFVLTCWVVVEFRSPSELAAAYGIAVSGTMVVTTMLACLVALQRWRWHISAVSAVVIFFLSIDVIFFAANISKVQEGGWVPLLIGAVLFTCMTTWKKGRRILMERLREKSVPFRDFIVQIERKRPARVPGTAVFMTGDPDGVPPALLHNLKHNRVLHEQNLLVTISTEEIPHVPPEDRVEIQKLESGFFRISAFYGFMDRPDVQEVLDACSMEGFSVEISTVTFFLGRETLIPTKRPGMAIWREYLFTFMSRNAERAISYYNIPPDQVVEIGIQVEL
ncbi:MAG: potassium transporter Kup [Bdellovibrionia bacterium]